MNLTSFALVEQVILSQDVASLYIREAGSDGVKIGAIDGKGEELVDYLRDMLKGTRGYVIVTAYTRGNTPGNREGKAAPAGGKPTFKQQPYSWRMEGTHGQEVARASEPLPKDVPQGMSSAWMEQQKTIMALQLEVELQKQRREWEEAQEEEEDDEEEDKHVDTLERIMGIAEKVLARFPVFGAPPKPATITGVPPVHGDMDAVMRAVARFKEADPTQYDNAMGYVLKHYGDNPETPAAE